MQFLDKLFMPVVASGADGQTVQKTVESPQVQSLITVFMPVLMRLVLMARQRSTVPFGCRQARGQVGMDQKNNHAVG